MALIVKKTPDVEVSASELRQLRDEYQRSFMPYAGAPPDFDEWATAKIQRRRQQVKNAPASLVDYYPVHRSGGARREEG